MRDRALRRIFGCAIAAMCLLAFAWPFAVSPDPSQPIFKLVAITTLIVFFVSMIALLIARIARPESR